VRSEDSVRSGVAHEICTSLRTRPKRKLLIPKNRKRVLPANLV
jgi:hypothetical protein